jgi:hypothetical protein
VTVTISPGRPELLCCTLLPNSSLTSKTASCPHGCPGPSTAPTNARTTPARSVRPATRTLSRTVAPIISAPAFPGRPRPTRPRTDTQEMHAHLSRGRQAGSAPRTGFPHKEVISHLRRPAC